MGPAHFAPVGCVLIAASCLIAAPRAFQSSEEIARRQYENGLVSLRDAKYDEAVRDFQAVVAAYPQSTVADDALLEIARYQLGIARNLDAARSAIDQLIKNYGTGNAAPHGYVLSGEIVLAAGRQPGDLQRALSEFERVVSIFPGSSAIPAAFLARAETLRIAGRCDEALEQFGQAVVEYPRSAWAAQANIGASRCQVARGKPFEAIAELQRASRNTMAGEHGSRARALNSVLYRLYIRPPQSPFAFAAGLTGATGRIRDLVAMGINRRHLFTVSGGGASVLDLENKGQAVRTTKLEDARGVFIDFEGRSVLYSSRALIRESESALTLSVPKPDRTVRLLEDMTAVAALSTGELIAADGDGATTYRFNRDLKLAVPFPTGRAHRLAVGSLDQVAVFDRVDKIVNLWTRDGKPLGRITQRGQGWQLDEPVDIAFDSFDHLYVLDRGVGTVWIFSYTPTVRLLTSFTIPEKAPGAFRRATAMALDAHGRLYIHDDRAERVQVYQ